MSNFVVKQALGKLRPVSSLFIIVFTKTTLIQILDNENFLIPRHKFEIVNLTDLHFKAKDFIDEDLPEYAYGKILCAQVMIVFWLKVLNSILTPFYNTCAFDFFFFTTDSFA